MQTFLALLTGYFLLSALRMLYLPLITFFIFRSDPAQTAAQGFSAAVLAVILLLDLVAGFVAGYTTGRVAGFQPLRHGYYLTILVFMINIGTLVFSGPEGSWWYASARLTGLLLIIPLGARLAPQSQSNEEQD